jgi:SAM-dependent methyltransferase
MNNKIVKMDSSAHFAFPLPADGLWRIHMQAVYQYYLKLWLGEDRFQRILKTDLFDEATLPFAPALDLIASGSLLAGIDFSYQMAFRASRNLPQTCRLVTADVRNLPFQSASFDLIFSNSTLDHFNHKSDIGASLQELARVLTPGGRLLITMDNPHNPVIRLRNWLPFKLMHFFKLVPYYMGATLSLPELLRAMEERGFRIHHSTFADYSPRQLINLFWHLVKKWPNSNCVTAVLRILWRFERWCGRSPLQRLGCFIVVWAEKQD